MWFCARVMRCVQIRRRQREVPELANVRTRDKHQLDASRLISLTIVMSVRMSVCAEDVLAIGASWIQFARHDCFAVVG